MRTAGPLGTSVRRPDGLAKATGSFAYSADVSAAGELWGATVRSPHPHARLVALDCAPALALPGVRVVLTAEDVPGRRTFGLDAADQPVLVAVGQECHFHGEPVALVAAESRELARAAAEAVVATWVVLEPLTDPERALATGSLRYRELLVECGDGLEGPVAVEGTYTVGVQDQAFLAPEAALATPVGDGGVHLVVATQWLHSDRDQVAACLGLAAPLVRVSLGGVGGAFGGREDVTLQVHVCLLALAVGAPVRMVWTRAESFLGHVHRHPAVMHYRHTAELDGTLVSVTARMVLDGGAYQSSSAAVLGNVVTMGAGPYRVPHARLEGVVVRTDNPPNGAMRGFGNVQTCFAHEAQMDLLADALGMDPVALRLHNALRTGDRLPTGQVITGSAPMTEVLTRLIALPLPAGEAMFAPGGQGDCADPARVRRGVAVAAGFKNLMFSEGFDDPSTAEVTLDLTDGGVVRATVRSACAEVGQGFVTLVGQLVRSELGADTEVVLAQANTTTKSAGSTSASRQTWMSGGAVREATITALGTVVDKVAAELGEECELLDGVVVGRSGRRVPLTQALRTGAVSAERTFRHAPTQDLGPRGQGDAHVAWAFVAHRAVVDVDLDLGTVALVQLATAQDVGTVLNPVAVVGQLEGGAAQGVGLALTEELALDRGIVTSQDFSDYLLPTAVDLCEVLIALVTEPEPGAPWGAKGVGEAPNVSSTPAVVGALRAATGKPLQRTPVRLEHLVDF